MVDSMASVQRDAVGSWGNSTEEPELVPTGTFPWDRDGRHSRVVATDSEYTVLGSPEIMTQAKLQARLQ
jgi:hypothetical protein